MPLRIEDSYNELNNFNKGIYTVPPGKIQNNSKGRISYNLLGSNGKNYIPNQKKIPSTNYEIPRTSMNNNPLRVIQPVFYGDNRKNPEKNLILPNQDRNRDLLSLSIFPKPDIFLGQDTKNALNMPYRDPQKVPALYPLNSPPNNKNPQDNVIKARPTNNNASQINNNKDNSGNSNTKEKRLIIPNEDVKTVPSQQPDKDNEVKKNSLVNSIRSRLNPTNPPTPNQDEPFANSSKNSNPLAVNSNTGNQENNNILAQKHSSN